MTHANSRRLVRDPASFRDHAGFVFGLDGRVYRQVQRTFAQEWDAFDSTLRPNLVAAGLLIGHEDVTSSFEPVPDDAHRIIRPAQIPFISYPYEWTFGQLQDAALLTLEVQRRAQEDGFALRDASAYNVQFVEGRPIFIDSLSFRRVRAGEPWVAYRQFCEHFLGPLAVMAKRDITLHRLLLANLEGVPLELARKLLPRRTMLSLGLATHLHVHSFAQRRHTGRRQSESSHVNLGALIESLRETVQQLSWRPTGTEWSEYTPAMSYRGTGLADKDRVVRDLLSRTKGQRVWDLGANTGRYSAIAASLGRTVLALDGDPGAAERHYRRLKAEDCRTVQPLVVDLAAPSPGLGWANRERRPLTERDSPDVVLALALVHHLAIGRNVPLESIADWLATIAPQALIEFVPPEDPMAAALLDATEHPHADYHQDGFERSLQRRWHVLDVVPLAESDRIVYRLERR